MPTIPETKRQILERGVRSLLEEAKVPQQVHLRIIQQLRTAIDRHRVDMTTHGDTMRRHEKQMTAHERQIAKWDAIVEHVLSLKPQKGDQGDAAPSIDEDKLLDTLYERIDIPSVNEIALTVLEALPGMQGKTEGGKEKANPVDYTKMVEMVIKKIQKDRSIDVSHIRNAESFLFNGKKYKIEELMRGAGGTQNSSGTAVYNEVVAGGGTAWTLANTPTTDSLRLFANGQRLTPGIDYMIAGDAITTVLSWAAGTLLADYIYA